MLNAIGLIESKGLVALVEAADVILKNSPVEILGIKKLENGLVSLAVFGSAEYVNAAIESAVEAGRRVGEIYASTVIDDPGKELMSLFSELFAINNTIEDSSTYIQTGNVPKVFAETNKEVPTFGLGMKKDKTGFKREKSKPLSITKIASIRSQNKVKDKPSPENKTKLNNSLGEESEIIQKEPERHVELLEIKKPMSTIERLRIEALGLENKKIILNENALQVKKKSDESKRTNLLQESSEVDFDSINQMNVHKLRHYARGFPEFPIKGREISRANRDELIELFKSISNK